MKRLLWAPPVVAGIAAAGLLYLLVQSILDLRTDAVDVGDKAAVAQAIAAAAGLLVSVVLVMVTTWYVVETRRMVGEMRSSRIDASRPSLLLRVESINVTNIAFGLVNAGPGAARDIDLTLTFTRPAATTVDQRSWRYQYMAPGDSFQFLPLGATGAVTTDLDRVLKGVTAVHASGTALATDGTEYLVDATVDVTAWGRGVRAAHQRFSDTPGLRTAKALEKLADKLESDPYGAARLEEAVNTRHSASSLFGWARGRLDRWFR